MKLSSVAQSVTQEARYKITVEGADTAARQIDGLAKAQTGAAQSADVLARQQTTSEKAITRVASKLESYARGLDPLTKALRDVERGESLVAAARARGIDVTDSHLAAVEKARARYEKLAASVNDNSASFRNLGKEMASLMSKSGGMTDITRMTARMSASTAGSSSAIAAGLARHEWVNLSRQLQDVGVSLYGGQSPLTVLAQQGGQIADVFSSSRGGAGAAIKEFGATVAGYALNPITLFVAGAGAATAAVMRWTEAQNALTVSMNGLGRSSGLTVAQIGRLSSAGGGAAGISNVAARGMATDFLNAGVPGGSIGGAIGVSRGMSSGLGLSLDQASGQLASTLADPARGAEELARKYGLVTFAQREQIKQLAAVGDRSAAAARLLEILQSRIASMEDPTSRLSKWMDRAAVGFSNFLDRVGHEMDGEKSFKQLFDPIRRAGENRRQAQADLDAQRNKELDGLRDTSAYAVREIQARTFAEKEAVATQRAFTETLRETNDQVKASISAESERAKLLAESSRKAADLLRGAQDQGALSRLSPYARAMREVDFKYRDARQELLPSGAAGGGLFSSIIRAEGTGRFGDPYNTSLGYMKSPKPLTSMTMAESLAWGDNVRKAQGLNSSAKGAFQIVNSTQRAAMGALGLGMDAPFSVDNQQAMASWIYKKQGIGAWEGFKKGGAGGSSIGADLSAAQSSERAARQYEMIQKPLEDANKELDRQKDLLRAQAGAFSISTHEVARATKEQELLNQYQAQGVPITEALRREIGATATKYADLADDQEGFANSSRTMIENFDTLRSSASEVFGGITQGLLNGKSAAESFEQSLKNVASRVTSLAVDRVIEGLFGRGGTGGGGAFGSLFSGSSFANGGIMTGFGPARLRRYAGGGVASTPQLAMYGEGSRPEAFVPLPDGRSIPVSMQGSSAPPVTVNLIGAPAGAKVSEKTDARGGRRIDVVFDERVAQSIASRSGVSAMGGAFGVRQSIARR